MLRRTITLLIAAVLILASIGLVMLASASMIKGASESQFQNDPTYFWFRQLRWMGISLVAAFVSTRVPVVWMKRVAVPLAAVCAVLLVLVRIPGIGVCINGSWRWFRIGPFTLQPSEFAKIGVILLASWWIARNRRYMHTFQRGMLIPMCGLGLFALLLVIEPDFGTAFLFGAVVILMLFIAGSRIQYLLALGLLGSSALGVVVWHNPNRMRRIMAFLDPEKYAQEEAWQLVNALNAFASGGVRGSGLANSIQKHYYLPEAHTDFIFPIIGEELGLVATLSILVLFIVIFFCGLRIFSRASDDFGRFTALGCTLMLTLQALINLAVVTGCMPTKGLALPFISYGGSSFIASSVMTGMLVNIAHTARHPKEKKRMALFKDTRRQL